MKAANYRNRAAMGPQGGLAADSGDRPPAIKTDIVMVSGVQARAAPKSHPNPWPNSDLARKVRTNQPSGSKRFSQGTMPLREGDQPRLNADG